MDVLILRVQDAQDDSMDVGGTIPGKESIESSLEARSLPLGYRDREQRQDNHRNVIGRVVSGSAKLALGVRSLSKYRVITELSVPVYLISVIILESFFQCL